VVDDPWRTLDYEAMEIFSPSAPIDEAELFAGRQDQLRRLMQAVAERGRHAVLYGERGVGKTSLTNIFHLLMQPVVTRQLKPIRKQAGPADDFSSLWRRVFEDIEVQIARDGGTETYTAGDFYSRDLVPDDVLREFSAIGANLSPVIIFDEFDTLPDDQSRRMMSHTMKAFSDMGVRGTIVLVGVGDDIQRLVAEHASVERNISEIKMPRMSGGELSQILDKRIRRLGMTIDGDAGWKIVTLARGLPAYVHSLGRDAARNALKLGRMTITDRDVDHAINELIKDSDRTTSQSYNVAVHSNKRNSRFREALLAAAVCSTDDEGRFIPSDMVRPFGAIVGRKVEIANFQTTLNAFTEPGRGAILEKSGTQRAFKYRFTEPKMQPYVIMRGMADGLLPGGALSIPSGTAQTSRPAD
jgi:hypothetical protein